MSALLSPTAQRTIVRRTRGRGHGPITRLMSPGDLGQVLKPFVFLDLFQGESSFAGGMPIHPHSGLATVTVVTEGDFRFDDPASGEGELAYGGVEWMRAGGGVWHGKELSPGASPRIAGFQLWLALPPELENGPVDSQYIEAKAMPASGPVTVILGKYAGLRSPVRAPEGVHYLLVTLQPGQAWTYAPPEGHDAAWLAVSHGQLVGPNAVAAGEMAVFDASGTIELQASQERSAVFVIGSAEPHPHDLVTGMYSVHTSRAALAKGEASIQALAERMALQPAGQQRRTAVFSG
ncbi:pirin family protein [Acidovorax sp. NCPPB 3576]|uniref:pirin family protein n=1 Tax=Acidovorax sp. NCPPB 3576 TaxID=2940488 RepID=UPI00234A3FC2|nr:pirin family protein [Acidovorax sp. NCPPB 3576]WCM89947.1 pirin family protein [Acidovorax sp. NCPPB 3576]